MSERLYSTIWLPVFEMELKNRQLMVNHKAVYFDAEPLEMILGYNLILDNLATLSEMFAGLMRSRRDSSL